MVMFNCLEKKNFFIFESYCELVDFFYVCVKDEGVKVIVVMGVGGNFLFGGDVFEIIGLLVEMDMKYFIVFICMIGELVKVMWVVF